MARIFRLSTRTLTPFLFALGLSWSAVLLYVVGAAIVGEPGVWRAMLGPRLLIMFGVLGPLAGLAALLVAVIVFGDGFFAVVGMGTAGDCDPAE